MKYKANKVSLLRSILYKSSCVLLMVIF